MNPTMDKEQTKKEVMQAFWNRHATKVFDDQRRISEEDFDFILETARLSPSSFGLEPWKLVVLQNRELRDKLLPLAWGAKGQLPTASHFVLILARTHLDMHFDAEHVRYMREEIKKLPPEMYQTYYEHYRRFQETHFNLLESERAMFDWACKQTYIPLANMMSAAAMIGVDSCPIEGFARDEVDALLQNEGILGGDNFRLSVMVAFGYRKDDPRPKTRQPVQSIVQWI